jgi:AbrB family looped-hinge helix DNA binding protein
MIVHKIKVTAKGQVTLPKAMREKLDLKKGDYLDALLQNNTLVLKPVPRQSNEQAILAYCKKHSQNKADLKTVRKILAKVPYSLADRVSELRKEGEDV